MQGIPYFNYKYLHGNLEKIKAQSESLGLPAEHLLAIHKYQEKLTEMYDKYEDSLKELALLIKEYKDYEKSIYQLHIIHRRNKMRFKKSGTKKATM
jgi:hypothetical protein